MNLNVCKVFIFCFIIVLTNTSLERHDYFDYFGKFSHHVLYVTPRCHWPLKMLSIRSFPPALSAPVKTNLKLFLAFGIGLTMLLTAHLLNMRLSSGDFGKLNEGKITVLRTATLSMGPNHDGLHAQAVVLPSRIDSSVGSHVSYRLMLPLGNTASASAVYGVCVPRWSSNAVVSLDGQKLLDLDDKHIAAKALNRAAYLNLPSNLSGDGHHLDIRLRVIAGTMPGLSEIWFGEEQQVRQKCIALQDVSMGARIGGIYLMMFIAFMAAGIALYQRDKLTQGLCIMTTLWSLHSSLLLDWIAFAEGTSWLALVHLTRPLPAFAAIYVALQLSRGWNRFVQRSLTAIFVVGYLTFPFLPIEHWNTWLVVQIGCMLPFVLTACFRLILHSAHSNYLSDFAFGVALLFGIGINLMDLGRNKGWLPYSGMSLTYLVVPVFALAIGFLVLERLREFLRQQKEHGCLLQQKLQEQKLQLDVTHQTLLEQREKLLLNAERQRMVQDMHDGLGSQLVSASALLKSGQNLQSQAEELTALIDNALLDLRSLLDVFSTAAQKNKHEDDTVSLLLSMLRHRLTPIFRTQGMHLQWDTEPLPAKFLPDDRQRLQLLRLLQEACANIIKHSQATVVTLRTRAHAQHIEIEVRDNGQGIEKARHQATRKSGHGLNNIAVRAQRLHAQLVIDSDASGTAIRLIFPLPGMLQSGKG